MRNQKTYDPITEPEKLRNRALYWLGQREFSVHDFRNKLERVCEDEVMIENLLEDFIARDWLNEQRYMASFVRQKMREKKWEILLRKNTLRLAEKCVNVTLTEN